MTGSAGPPSPPHLLSLVCKELFGRVLVIWGSFFFLGGSIFALLMFDPVNVLKDVRLSGAPVIRGWLDHVSETRFGEGSSSRSTDRSSIPFFVHHFSYRPPGEAERRGRCYSTGEMFLGPGFVDVEYDLRLPGVSRIRGTRCSLYGPSSIVILVFPLLGLGVSIGAMIPGIRRIRRWRSGAEPLPERPSRGVAFAATVFVLGCHLGGPAIGGVVWMSNVPEVPVSPLSPKPPREETLYLGEGVDLVFVRVPEGRFRWGGWDGNKDERPPRDVTISGFHLGKFEVTVRQFQRFVQTTGYRTEAEQDGKGGGTVANGRFTQSAGASWREPGFRQGDDAPVVLVSRKDAEAFAAWVSRHTDRDVRLPTEAQWEYGARGGSGAGFPWGNTWDSKRLNHGDLTLKESGFVDMECTADRDGFVYTAPVGRFPDGASWCGAMDMAGNVFEWTRDPYDYHYYGACPEIDPPGPAKGDWGNIRGGGWAHGYLLCRSRGRYAEPPGSRWTTVGFRLALLPPSESR